MTELKYGSAIKIINGVFSNKYGTLIYKLEMKSPDKSGIYCFVALDDETIFNGQLAIPVLVHIDNIELLHDNKSSELQTKQQNNVYYSQPCELYMRNDFANG